MNEQGPRLLGVLLPCTRNYAVLDDLSLEEPRKDRLFFALLSAQYPLLRFRRALELHRLSYPKDLLRIGVRAAALPAFTCGNKRRRVRR